MKREICSMCGKRIATVFVTQIDQAGNQVNKGLCIVCAKRAGMPQADKFALRMGIAADDLAEFAQTVKATEQTAPGNGAETASPARFRLLNSFDVDGRTLLIMLDADTGIQYLTNPQFSGFSPLLDRDGRPLLYQQQESMQ